MSSIGSLKFGGRYNPLQTFEALYLANNPVTALQQVNAVVQTASGLLGVKEPAMYSIQTIEALKVPSARDSSTYNLVVFADKLSANSYLRVYDDSGIIDAQLP